MDLHSTVLCTLMDALLDVPDAVLGQSREVDEHLFLGVLGVQLLDALDDTIRIHVTLALHAILLVVVSALTVEQYQTKRADSHGPEVL